MFLVACTELTGPKEDAGETIAQGMGQVHIRLNQLNARTVIPGLEGLHFTLVFTQGTASKTENLASGLMTLTVALESGTWDLEVKGYSDSNILTVRGKSTITITAGISSNVTVYLTPDFSEGGLGTLSSIVSFPETVSQAFLSLYSLDAQETYRETTISRNAVKTLDNLPSGSYQAFIDLYDGTKNKAAVWTGVVHIYDGSTTLLKQNFEAANFAACPPELGKGETTLAAKLEAALASESGSYTIVLDATEAAFAPKDLKVTGNKNITLILRGSGETVHLNGNGSLFTLGAASDSSLTLVIQDITLEGKSNNTAPVVQVNSGGTLEVKAGSSLTSNTSSGNGGGVSVASGGTLTMSGGEIRDNKASASNAHGGGVYVAGGAIFTMTGGEISGNSTPNSTSDGDKGGGGVYVASGGAFTMSGGVVSLNSSGFDGGGVLVNGGTFTMSDGVVSLNSSTFGGGVYVINGGTFIMSDGVVSLNSSKTGGGGVIVNGGAFTMSGGVVSFNSSTSGGGVGIYGNGIFTMKGGVIYGSDAEAGKANTAQSGAAIYKYSGKVDPSDLVTGTVREETIDMRTS
jgi:hypothetical protein